MEDISRSLSHLDLSDDSDIIEDDEEGVALVQTEMFPSDGNAEYRTQNSTSDPFQRKTGIDRQGVLSIRCKILDIVHGKMSPDESSSFATLIVFKCTFFSRKHSRRARSADIELVFRSMDAEGQDPEVVDISPRGKYCLMPETEEQTVTREASGGISAPLVGGVGSEGTLKWQKVGFRQKRSFTTVIGETAIIGRNEGEDNAAGWTLLENPISQDGVPEAFRGAILLKRKGEKAHFQCDLGITVKTDRWTSFANLFKSAPLDDPILFDPKLPSTNNLMVYATDNLSGIRLQDLEDINIMKIKSGVVYEDPVQPA